MRRSAGYRAMNHAALSLGERVASRASQVRGYFMRSLVRSLLGVQVTPHSSRAGS